MRLSAEANIADIERALTALAGTSRDEHLKLPTNPRHAAAGGEAALAQFILTWAQARAGGTLDTYIAEVKQIDDFVRRFTGIVAALCARDILGHGKTGSLLAEVRRAALARLDLLQSAKPRLGYRGPSAEILCADHLGRDNPYLLNLPGKTGSARLRPREVFPDLASWLLRRTVPTEYQALIAPETPEGLGGMIFELFKNTQDHARVDCSGNLLDISIRALKTLHHAVRPELLVAMVRDYPPLAHFCGSLRPPRDAVQTHLFELSVLDAGPGFAVSRLGRPLATITREEEEAAVRQCFATFTAKGSDRFGQGLPHVLRLLRHERGFLRLRTGRVSLHADFSNDPSPNDGEVLQFHRSPGQEELAPVAGSLLTVLIPLRRV